MVRFDLRISEELNNWLIEQARRNHRSKNKQIEFILEMARKAIYPTLVKQDISGFKIGPDKFRLK